MSPVVHLSNWHLDHDVVLARAGRSEGVSFCALPVLPIPEPDAGPAWTAAAGRTVADLVVYDTFDGAYGSPVPFSREHGVDTLRELRRQARQQSTTVIVTFRLAPTSWERGAASQAWLTPPWFEAAQDASDVVVQLDDADWVPGARPHVVDVRVASCTDHGRW